MRLSAKCDTSKGFAQLDALRRGVDIGRAIALTKTAKLIEKAEVEEMKAVFDRPTPFTLNSVFITPATPENLEAEVFIKDETIKGRSAREYLIPELEGGVRVEKRSEAILRKTGILPPGMFVVPGAGAKLDQYGNIGVGQIQQILSALRVSETVAGHTSDRPRDKRRQRKGLPQFFVSRRSGATRHLPRGIWLRQGRNVKPIMIFVNQASYQKRLDFERVGTDIVNLHFEGLLREQMEITARKYGV